MSTETFNRARSFRHGIHPRDYKEMTNEMAIERMPFAHELVLPLSQHLGAPSVPIVKKSERVQRGQVIAEAGGFVSSMLHAPATGTIAGIERHSHPSGAMVDSIVLRPDPTSPQLLVDEGPIRWQSMDPDQLVELVRSGGFVGLGGAAFPTHVKLAVPEGKRARFFIVNAAECEPFLNSDYRILLERTASIFEGIRVVMKLLGSEMSYIGVEDNKMDAVALLRRLAPPDLPCEIIPLKTKYPQGAEKMLTEAVLRKEIPSGKLPIDIHVLVNNVGTVAGIGDLVQYNQPLIERVVTVTGPGIARPANLMIPLGTKLSDVIAFCGGLRDNVRQILFGGPMMGSAQKSLDVPIMKGTSGLLFLTDNEVLPRQEYACIKCQRCVDACPVFLNPSRLGGLARMRLYEDMLDFNILDCMECGSCSYVCPSNIPLVQRFRVAKVLLKEQQRRRPKDAESAA